MNFLGIAARYTSVRLIILEIAACAVFLESEEKGSYEENIENEASKRSGLGTKYLRETMFSLANACAIRVAQQCLQAIR